MKTIERLRELLGKATGGTWRGEVDNPRTLGDVTSDTGGVVANVIVCFDECEDEAVATTELIAATRNSLPALLAVVEAQAAEIEKWRGLADARFKGRTMYEGDQFQTIRDARTNTNAALRALEGGE